MINLVESATLIVQNNPEMAEPLYDALLFMENPRARLSSEFSETKAMLWALTSESEKQRKIYEKSRAA